MYIPETIPTNITEMMAFLTHSPSVIDDGIFDSLAYDSNETPTKIYCYKGKDDNNNDIKILEIYNSATNTFQFTAYTGEASTDDGRIVSVTRTINTSYTGVTWLCIMRCKGGIGFINRSTNDNYKYIVVIGKTSSGKIGIIMPKISRVGTSSANTVTPTPYSGSSGPDINWYLQIVYGDDTKSKMWDRGWSVVEQSCNADRTILEPIPVIGRYGSTDQFTTVFARRVMQYNDNGAQIINGKQYGCIYDFCILDEDPE